MHMCTDHNPVKVITALLTLALKHKYFIFFFEFVRVWVLVEHLLKDTSFNQDTDYVWSQLV